MKTIYEIIWSTIGIMLIVWFMTIFVHNCRYEDMHDGMILPAADSPQHQKQSIEEFLRDHPDIKKRVDELNRQAERDASSTRS